MTAIAEGAMTGIQDLKSNLNLARRADAPVLITGPHDFALRVANVIAAREGKKTALKVCDASAIPDALPAAVSAPPNVCVEAVLVIRDVHALNEAGQATVLRILDNPRKAGYRRIVATSPVCLYDCVRRGTFSSALYYRLNIIHIAGGGLSEWSWLSTHYGPDGTAW